VTFFHRVGCDYMDAGAPAVQCDVEAWPYEAFPEIENKEPPCAQPEEAFVSMNGWVYGADAMTICPKHEYGVCADCSLAKPKAELENAEHTCDACHAGCAGCGAEKPADDDPLCDSCRARSDRKAENGDLG
jgi:hypothetical protein